MEARDVMVSPAITVGENETVRGVASVRPKLEISPSDATIRSKLMDELKTQPWSHPLKLNVTVAAGLVDLWGLRRVRRTAESYCGGGGDNLRRHRRERSPHAQACAPQGMMGAGFGTIAG